MASDRTEWWYRELDIHEMTVAELLYVYDNFDFPVQFPDYGKVALDVFIRILKPCHCFLVYREKILCGMLYFEPQGHSEVLFHFANFNPILTKNRGYIVAVREILNKILDKQGLFGYNCIYGHAPSDTIVRYSRLFGFRVIGKNDKHTILKKVSV